MLDLLLAGDDDPGEIEPADLRRFEAYARTLLAQQAEAPAAVRALDR